jgi:hypothetical protein
MAYFREQIADVGAVPVLDLRESVGAEQPTPEPAPVATRGREPADRPAQERTRGGLRVPWQRRPRRQPQPVTEPLPAG